jgi:ABC-type sugar transport system ATPase subunit
VENLSINDTIENISFNVCQGEIVGLGGLVGAGAQEIGRAIFGDIKPRSGLIRKNGRVVQINSPADAVALNIGYVPKDRDKEGLILRNSVRRNIALTVLEQLTRAVFLDLRQEKRISEEYYRNLRIKAPNVATLCLALSGGNRQKVVLAKWLAANSDVLILNNPTRGVDVGAKAEIYRLMMDLRHAGLAILMISEELPELLGMSDRILIIRKGRISAEFSRRDQPTEEQVIQYMI